MVSITLPDELAQRLAEVARRENRPVETVALEILEQYTPPSDSQAESDAAFEAIFGMFDDVTDLSVTVRETIQEHFRKKDVPTD